MFTKSNILRGLFVFFVFVLVGIVMYWLYEDYLYIGFAFLLLSPLVGYLFVKQYRFYSIITEEKSFREESVGNSIDLEGEITAIDSKDNSSPLDNSEPVIGWEIYEWDEQGDISNWVQRGVSVLGHEITLETEDNRTVTVETPTKISTKEQSYLNKLPAGNSTLKPQNGLAIEKNIYSLDQDKEKQVTVEPKETPPDSIKELLQSLEDVEEGEGSITNLVDFGKKHGKRKYVIHTFNTDDSLYIRGVKEEDAKFGTDRISLDSPDYSVFSIQPREEFKKNFQHSVVTSGSLLISTILIGLYGVLVGVGFL